MQVILFFCITTPCSFFIKFECGYNTWCVLPRLTLYVKVGWVWEFCWENYIILIDDLPVINGKISYGRRQRCLHLLVQSVRIPTVILITDYSRADTADSTSRYWDELQTSLQSAGACKVTFVTRINCNFFIFLFFLWKNKLQFCLITFSTWSFHIVVAISTYLLSIGLIHVFVLSLSGQTGKKNINLKRNLSNGLTVERSNRLTVTQSVFLVHIIL